jgi:predicted PurR-regulated permease PerM
MKFDLSIITSILLSSKNKLLNNLCRYFKQMKSIPFLLIAFVSLLLFSMTASTPSPLFAQQNDTSTAVNQTGEAGQTAVNQTGEAGQTVVNQTGEALTNASKSDVAQNISQGGQEIGQTVANETGDIFGSISEGLKGLFGMK